MPGETSELTWRVEFEPAGAFHYPPEPADRLHVESRGADEIQLVWNESYWLNAGYQVYVDDQLLGYTPRSEARLRGFDPSKTHAVVVETVAEDGTPSRRRAEMTISPESITSE